ncbi:MAG: Lar family restriction alleviation protein [Synergistaceae bacterium]|nr:Lar family restriction alleviation protein [Synergistaceae bacterium]
MTEELRTCPKCGGTDCGLIALHEVCGLNWYQVACRTCGTSSMWKTSVDETVDDWNRREPS